MDLGLTGRTAVVTGASKGIGLATARRLAAEGMRVLGVARTPTPELAAVAEPYAGDLTEPATATALAEVVGERFDGGLDLLVNNAGGLHHSRLGGFADLDDGNWVRTFELNLFSAVRLTRALLPALLARRGVVVNVSSVGARIATPGTDYGAAKAALTNLTSALAEEYGPQGLRAVTVTPGPTRTYNWTDPDSLAGQQARAVGMGIEQLAAAVPERFAMSTGRLAEPEEPAAAIAFLASPHAANVTGADLAVDGGLLKAV